MPPIVTVNTVQFSTALMKDVGHAKDIIARDKARAQKMLAGVAPHGPLGAEAMMSLHAPAKGESIDCTDIAVTYTCPVMIGEPPECYDLLIDTGSSNTWIGAKKQYKPSATSQDLRKAVHVGYGSGSFSGAEFADRVSLSRNLTIEKQSFGVAHTVNGIHGVDGILGVGPMPLTAGTMEGNEMIPTIMDNLYSQKKIETECLSVSFVPTTSKNSMPNGEMTFGAVDPNKYTGEISYVPITNKSPASHYWGCDQDMQYGDAMIMKNGAGIVDTGTTLVLLATQAFKAYKTACGAIMDNATGLLTVSEEQYAKMQNLSFKIGDTTFDLTPNAQIWPRALNTMLGGEEGKIYLIVADLGSDLGTLDFINGFCFLQRFYSVYDTTNKRIGLATTEFTSAMTN